MWEPYPPGRVPPEATAGCVVLATLMLLLCLIPLYFLHFIEVALSHLHLSPPAASAVMLGILLGGLVNIPVYRVPREEEVSYVWDPFGLAPVLLRRVPVRRETIIAVNLGGCVIPVLLAVWELKFIAAAGSWPVISLLVALGVSVGTSYHLARPVPGIGIMMPAWAAPVAAIGSTCVLLAGAEYATIRAPVAFVAGVSGPLIGADLMHLPRVLRMPTGMLSIGGAGTFDGIVLSGLLAALVCGWLAS